MKRYNSSGTLSDNFTYTYAANKNRLSTITGSSATTYTYDDNGNVTGDSHITKNIALIIYDADNLPVTVYKTDGGQHWYSYDVNGQRVRKNIVGGSDTYYINGYDGRTEAVNLSYTGNNFVYNIWGNDNIGQVRVISGNPTRYYYLKDHLGSIRMTVNSTGGIAGYDDYYPFGMVMPNRSMISGADYRYKFTGKERDVETGYDYFGARYYDSRMGRWLQADPLSDEYASWSPYNYVADNPVNNIDIDGARWVTIPVPSNPGQFITVWELDEEVVVTANRLPYETTQSQAIPFPGLPYLPPLPLPRHLEGQKINANELLKDAGNFINKIFDNFPVSMGTRTGLSPVPINLETRKTGKEKSSDKPSWVQEKPRTGESGKEFAKRLLDGKYGKNNYDKGPASEFNKIQKWADRLKK